MEKREYRKVRKLVTFVNWTKKRHPLEYTPNTRVARCTAADVILRARN